MTEDVTPPSSLVRCSPLNQEFLNLGVYRPFDCISSRSGGNNLDIHDELYLIQGHVSLGPVTNPSYGDDGSVNHLFFYKSLDDLAIWSPIEELFRVCRMKLMMASSWKEPQLEVRKNLLSELVALRSCVDRAFVDCLASETEEMILEYFKHLRSLRLLLGYLPDIPDCMLSYMWTPSASAFPEAWYNLFHLHLDLRWYHLTCMCQLVRARCDRMLLHPVLPSCRHIDEHFLEKQVVLLASELLELSIKRFEKIALRDLPHTTPYSCKCVEELWLMLQLLVEDMKLCLPSLQPFECIIRILLGAVEPRGNNFVVVKRSCSEVCAPDTFHCSNPVGFSLWLLYHVNQLSGYSMEGLYLGPLSSRVRSHYDLLSTVLRSCLGTDSSVTEEQLQVYLLLIKPLLTEWWELATEPIMVMWEYFHCRLNSAFYVRGAPPSSIAIMSSSGSTLLSQVRLFFDLPPSNSNSFVLFLNLLGEYLRRGVRENNRRAWQQLKGRLYSKFSPSKMVSFSELGLYHFTSLFLVLALTNDMKQVIGRCQELLGVLLNSDLDNGRRAVIWKANIAFLHLHIENGIDITELAKPFMSEVALNTGNSALMKMFIGDLHHILITQQDVCSIFPQHILFDHWLVPYLSGAPPGDASPLLELVLRQLRRGGEAAARLGACVLQFVKRQFAVRGAARPQQVCQLAVELTLLVARHPRLLPDSFAELFHFFGCSLVVELVASLQYLNLLLKRDEATQLLATHVPGYPSCLIQSWIRFLLLCQSPTDVASLTQVVASLPDIKQLCLAANVHLDSAEDAFQALVEAVGKAHAAASTEQGRIAVREKCISYFGQVAKYVEPLLREPPSYPAVQRVYGCVQLLIHNCKTLLHQKNSLNNILLSLVAQLFLPHQSEQDLHPHRLTAIRHHLSPLLKEITALVSVTDASVDRIVRQLVVKYLPMFSGTQHPLVQFFLEASGREGERLILQSISDEVLRSRGVILHKDAGVALAYLLQLTKQHRTDVSVLQLIIELCLRRVFEIAMFTSEAGQQQSQAACALLSALLTNPAMERSHALKESFCAVLLRLCSDSLAFSMVPLFKLLSLVTTFQPRLVEQVLPQLWVEVRRVESRRGVARDPALRAAMDKIDQAVKLKTGQHTDV